MDLVTLAPRASAEERAAVDGVLGPATSALGGRRPRRPGRRPVRPRRPRGARPARPPAAGPPRDPGPRRLDQPAGPQVRLPAPDRPAGRGLRRRHLLPDVRDDPAAAGRRPRLRRHRLPPQRERGRLRRPGARRSGRRATPACDGERDLAAQPLPRPLRARPDGALHGRRPRPGDDRRRAGRRRRGGRGARAGGRRSRARAAAPPGDPVRRATWSTSAARSPRPASPGLRLLAPGRRHRPAQPRRLPRERRLPRPPDARSTIGPAAVIAEVTASRLARPRRRRLPDRPQVGRRRRPAGAAPLPRLQRRRVGARHVQGPGAHGGGPVRDRRGDDDRGLRHGRRSAASSTCAASTRCRRPGWRTRSRPPARRATSAPDILGSGFSFDIELRRGAGAYICGEETALFESIEGKRGEPRNKPPFPVEVGLFGKPTAVNNVETLVNVPVIVADGGAAFAAIGTGGQHRPKLFCLSGAVERPGVYEVDFGATLGELLALAGGVPGGRALQAVLLGGAAGVFVGPDALDTAAHLRGDAGRRGDARLGRRHGLRRDRRPRRDAAAGSPPSSATSRAASASPAGSAPCARRSCSRGSRPGGRCGTPADELALLADIGQAMRDASICGLGQTALGGDRVGAPRPGLVDFGDGRPRPARARSGGRP